MTGPRPFHEKYGDSAAGGAGDMLDLIEEGAFVATGSGRLQPVSKAAVFREFMAPLDLEEEIVARDAEVALAFLVEQGMVEVADDKITVPGRFLPPDPQKVAQIASAPGRVHGADPRAASPKPA